MLFAAIVLAIAVAATPADRKPTKPAFDVLNESLGNTVTPPADVEAIQAPDGSVCFTVMYGGRTVFADIKGLPPNANPEAVKAVRQFWFKKTLAEMKLADRGNPFVAPWKTRNVTHELAFPICEGCDGNGGRGYSAWPGKKYPSGACQVCKGDSCVVYCVPSPTIRCVNPCYK